VSDLDVRATQIARMPLRRPTTTSSSSSTPATRASESWRRSAWATVRRRSHGRAASTGRRTRTPTSSPSRSTRRPASSHRRRGTATTPSAA